MDYNHSRNSGRGGLGGRDMALPGRPDNMHRYRQVIVMAFKGAKNEDIRDCFSKYGEIVKFRETSGSAHGHGITYSKTSEACRAIEEMHGRLMDGYPKPVKVILSVPRDEVVNRADGNAEFLRKIEVMVPSDYDRDSLKEHFTQWGDIEYVVITGWPASSRKASIKFYRQIQAAIAAENCDFQIFKPRFVIPTEDAKVQKKKEEESRGPGDEVKIYPANGPCMIEVSVPASMPNQAVMRLCSLIPNLQSVEPDPNSGHYVATYEYPQCAAYALDRMNGLVLGFNEMVRVRYYDPAQNSRQKLSTVSRALQQSMEMASSTGDLSVLAQSMKMAAQLLEGGGSSGAGQDFSAAGGGGGGATGGSRFGADGSRFSGSRFGSSSASGGSQFGQSGSSSSRGQAFGSGGFNSSGGFSSLAGLEDGSYCSVPLPPITGSLLPEAEPAAKVWVQTKKQFGQEVLLNLVLRFGDVVKAFFVKQNSYGFVTFTTDEAAQNFITTCSGCEIFNQPFQAEVAGKRKAGATNEAPSSKMAKV